MANAMNFTLARQARTGHDLYFGAATLILAIAIFWIDTFTSIESAIAVLYVIVILLAAEATNRVGLIFVTLGCVGLSLLSFILSHGPDPDFQTFLRLIVALSALCVTSALLLRNEQARTALLQTNAALGESEARYRSIFDGARVALWERDYSQVRDYLVELKHRGITDIKSYSRTHPEMITRCINMIGIVASNAAALELLGRSAGRGSAGVMARFIAPTNEAFLDVMQAILDGAKFFEGKAAVQTEAGEEKLVILSINFPDDPAAFNRVVVSMVDITQREEAQKMLVEAQAELARASKAATVGVLSASLAHELNQPLGAIVVNSQTLLRWLDRDPPDLASARRSAERIIRDSQRASAIIQNTRSMLSEDSPGVEQVDLSALVTDTLALMEHDLQREKTSVEIVQKSQIPSISVVKIEMQQVLINLIANASQAMNAVNSEKRIVTIELNGPPAVDHISISVKDTGNGLGEATDKLFTPFFTTKKNGLGMGLSICRSTLEARGGSLEGSNHPTGGAIFEIKMPLDVINA